MHSDDNATSAQLGKLLEKTLPCLQSDETELPDPYTKALTAYALVLAKKNDLARVAIDWLMKHAQNNNSLLWWQKTGLLLTFKRIKSNVNCGMNRKRSGSERGNDVIRVAESRQVGNHSRFGERPFHRSLAVKTAQQRRRFRFHSGYRCRTAGCCKEKQNVSFPFIQTVFKQNRPLQRTLRQLVPSPSIWNCWWLLANWKGRSLFESKIDWSSAELIYLRHWPTRLKLSALAKAKDAPLFRYFSHYFFASHSFIDI